MTVGELLKTLDTLSPFSLQEGWDNSGLIVGNPHQVLHTVVVGLDLDEDLIREMPEGTLFLNHHPLIFKGIKRFDTATYPANLLHLMIQKSQAQIALHTNFDQTHLNRYVATKVLGWPEPFCEGFVCTASLQTTPEALAKEAGRALNLSTLRWVPGTRLVHKVALTTGAGGSLMESVDADAFLTGDIKYHDAMIARSLGLTLIDIGHFDSERYFPDAIGEALNPYPFKVIIKNSKNPFDTLTV